MPTEESSASFWTGKDSFKFFLKAWQEAYHRMRAYGPIWRYNFIIQWEDIIFSQETASEREGRVGVSCKCGLWHFHVDEFWFIFCCGPIVEQFSLCVLHLNVRWTDVIVLVQVCNSSIMTPITLHASLGY